MRPNHFVIPIVVSIFSLISCGGDSVEINAPLNTTANALLVIGANDIFGEVRNESDNVPTSPAELIFARNVFDPPFGLLTPIKAPDGHQLSLSEWQQASGVISINCNDNSATVEISLEGLIPNGTYTFWINFINKKKTPGQSVDFSLDVIKIEPLGSGVLNIRSADNNGSLLASITHSSCILSDATTIVVVVDYHINGNTFGSNHIPDAEDVSHLLAYF